MEPADVVAQVDGSGLRGRGGAGFPTGRKASFLPKDRRPAYLCVNADESEPGTFKDREIMVRNPHALIEGVLIMSYAIGATSAFIYIRGEYRTEFEVLRRALDDARSRGYVGAERPRLRLQRDGGAPPRRRRLHLRRGDRAPLVARGRARAAALKPPFPAVAGLYAAPTLVNNVETLASVPFILEMGAEAYAAIGTERSKGTRVFSLSGNVRRPGNYELPLTSTLRDLIEGHGGGAPRAARSRRSSPAAPSTPILLPDQLDTGIDYESIAAAGSMAGSGAIVVIDDRTCMVQLALRVAEFYRTRAAASARRAARAPAGASTSSGGSRWARRPRATSTCC